jgi:putative PIN family toxin of toxin-antitoxin system
VKIVLDTNVLVSGLLNPHGPPGRVVDFVISGAVTVLFDDRIIAEYREVLARPRFGFGHDDVETLIDFITSEGESVTSPPLALSLPDPDDLPFIEVAVAGAADALVTGNADHFVPAGGGPPVHVCTPAQFVAHWLSSSGT